jgi:hypothetical protein
MAQRSFTCVLLLSALLCWMPTTRVQAAEVSTDLPGTPWVGPTVSTTVGGNIYDRVWELNLTEGKVVIIQTAGGAGAELGLYLFDSEVSSIYQDVPLKSSALPGSRQTIIASLASGTYYINVNGRNEDRPYPFSVTVSLYSDPTPPELFPQVVGGTTRVSGEFVTILSGAADGLSGVSGLRFRLSTEEWSEWSNSIGQATIRLPQDEGEYDIDFQAKNGLGLVSQIKSVSIIIDRTPPLGVLVGPISNGVVNTPLPTFTYNFNEKMNRQSLLGSIVINNFRGETLNGKTMISLDNTKASFTPTEALVVGQQYAINVIGATDIAGNIVSSTSAVLFAHREKTNIRVSSRIFEAAYGQVLDLRGVTNGIPNNAPLQIELRSSDSDEWDQVGTAVVRNGTLTGQFNPTKSGDYQVNYSGDLTRAASSSGRFSVSLLPALQLEGAGPKIRTRAVGSQLILTGGVTPAWAKVRLQRFRCNYEFSSCRRVGSEPVVVLPDGTFSFEWESTQGNWRFRLNVPVSEELAGWRTKFYSVRVR